MASHSTLWRRVGPLSAQILLVMLAWQAFSYYRGQTWPLVDVVIVTLGLIFGVSVIELVRSARRSPKASS